LNYFKREKSIAYIIITMMMMNGAQFFFILCYFTICSTSTLYRIA
jgi:hypothetical protein